MSFLTYLQLECYISPNHWPSFGQTLFLFCYENKFIQSSGSKQVFLYHEIVPFIDYLCAINDSFEFNDSFKDVYPPELELKVEHLENHAAFRDIDIKIVNDKIIYKLFDKRINFPLLC